MADDQSRKKERILELIDKFRKEEASEKEIREIDRWYDSFSQDEKYRDSLSPAEQMQVRDKLLRRLNQQIYQAGEPERKKFRFNYNWLAAAVIVLAASLGLYQLIGSQEAKENQLVRSDVPPGGNKAVLTLADGRRISLTDAANGQLTEQSGITVTKKEDGQLIYELSQAEAGSGGAPAYNTLSTPAGGQYQVRLPDGTKVWLNAASSLTYPAHFAVLKERQVELSGEAYFEVAPRKDKPFRVKTANQEIEVLGTHFNVNSYGDESSERTTLIEGAVKVTSRTGSALLKPGQEARVKEDIRIREADIETALSWKNGYFRFRGENIKSIMRELSRWYDIEVQYEGAISDEEYNGKISRFKNISQVLKMLEQTKTVHFKVDGRRVTVMEKQ